MARPLASSQKAKWNKLENFSVMTVALTGTVVENLNFQVAGFSGTLKGLAAISSYPGATVKDQTRDTVLYTIYSSNTPYIGNPQNPLFSYRYTAFNKIGLGAPTTYKTLFAGIIGEIPDGFQVAVACFRSSSAQSITVATGPATLKYFKLIFSPAGSQFITVSTGYYDLKKLASQASGSSDSQGEMEFIHLGPGGPQIESGQNLTISLTYSTTTYLVGIFLLEV
jgi:hypothetical protein